MSQQGRPTQPGEAKPIRRQTFTGNRALDMEEALIFETGRLDATGVDIDPPEPFEDRLGEHARVAPIGLPGLTEPETIRHYVRLSRMNYSIDAGIYPLGSCTMKHNPRLNEKIARLPGFADVHPLQPVSTAQGALEMIEALANALLTMTGMDAVAMSPKAGAHGELCGMMAIKAAIEARGEGATRRVVLVPDSAHGTNPATAALIGYSVRSVPAGADGNVSAEAVRAALAPDVAAIMLTNPNTCGLFERQIVGIAEAVHEAGAYFYCDGANFNAVVGKTRPGDLGVDAMHINLHKTFSTPHGGGHAGAGPVVFSSRLAPLAPGSVRDARRRNASPGRACLRAQIVRTDVRLSRANGDVRARARFHSLARSGGATASVGRRGAVRQLHPRLTQRCDERAVRRSSLHA